MYSGSRTAEEHPVDHRVERLRFDRRAGERGDRLGGRVRLLGGDAALLDREVGRVAGREDALEPPNLAVGVDRDEPAVGVGRHARDRTGRPARASRPRGRPASRREPGLIDTCPGAGVSQWAEGMNRMPFSSSSSRDRGSLACEPNSASGASSGVASVIDSSTFMS